MTAERLDTPDRLTLPEVLREPIAAPGTWRRAFMLAAAAPLIGGVGILAILLIVDHSGDLSTIGHAVPIVFWLWIAGTLVSCAATGVFSGVVRGTAATAATWAILTVIVLLAERRPHDHPALHTLVSGSGISATLIAAAAGTTADIVRRLRNRARALPDPAG